MLELLTQRQMNSLYGELIVENLQQFNTTKDDTGDVSLSEDQVIYWTVPEGVLYISAVAIGAGGSGEGSNSLNAGSGGGAGGLAYISDYPVRPGDTLKVYVGAKGFNNTDGGAGGRGDGASGIRYNGEVILLASSGGGGAGRTSPGLGGVGIIGDALFKGGDGVNGSTNYGGGGGDAPSYYYDGAAGRTAGLSTVGGIGGFGLSPYGQSGSGEHSGSFPTAISNGGIGGDYGGGGGGANDETTAGTDFDGGNGGKGVVRVIYGPGRGFPETLASEEYSQGNIRYISFSSGI